MREGGGAGRSGEPELTPGTRLAALWPYLVPEGGWVVEKITGCKSDWNDNVQQRGDRATAPPSLNTTTFPIAEFTLL